ncbi:MAG: DEAD/DEAH box helicase [Verrucomicrobia bacterium]|nr:DEAD/DEAH box helicase [Verrucomicrobiota bacterium]
MYPLDPAKLTDRSSTDEILGVFLDWLIETNIEPYAHQEQAVLELFSGHNVILNTPTGSGKSLVALALHFKAICQRRRSYYTVPIKALANEKFLGLCQLLGRARRSSAALRKSSPTSRCARANGRGWTT